MIRIPLLLNLLLVVSSQRYYCSHDSALKLLKRPTYEFSVKILERVSQETGGHFAYSPMSTWLQLVTLAEGAVGPTETEIWKVTRHHRVRCFRRKLRDILNTMDKELKLISKRSSLIIIDRLLKVKETFKNEVEKLRGVKILSLDFSEPVHAAAEANAVIDADMGGVITEAVYPSDFNLTVLLMTDAAYFRSDWKYPFNRAYTTIKPFFSEQGKKIGDVKMMNQVAYFNLVDIPLINARILELPCSPDDRVVMLVLLPTRGTISDLFYSLKSIRIMTIFNLYKRRRMQLVDVQLPRFKIISDVDTIPELVYDMGVKRVFYPHLANLGGISDYEINASLMSQIADVEVVEEGITATFVAEYLVTENETAKFIADRPFAFLVVDKKTEMILFAGGYTAPSIY